MTFSERLGHTVPLPLFSEPVDKNVFYSICEDGELVKEILKLGPVPIAAPPLSTAYSANQ